MGISPSSLLHNRCASIFLPTKKIPQNRINSQCTSCSKIHPRHREIRMILFHSCLVAPPDHPGEQPCFQKDLIMVVSRDGLCSTGRILPVPVSAVTHNKMCVSITWCHQTPRSCSVALPGAGFTCLGRHQDPFTSLNSAWRIWDKFRDHLFAPTEF